jgi:hypothetical protein
VIGPPCARLTCPAPLPPQNEQLASASVVPVLSAVVTVGCGLMEAAPESWGVYRRATPLLFLLTLGAYAVERLYLRPKVR